MRPASKMLPVKSSGIEAVAYDEHGIHVRFKGGAHHVFPGASRAEYGSMLAAESLGSYVHSLGKRIRSVKL